MTKTFRAFLHDLHLREITREDGYVSAVEHAGQVYHLGGQDHYYVVKHALEEHGIHDESKQNDAIEKMKFGHYHPEKGVWSHDNRYQRRAIYRRDKQGQVVA